MRMNSDAEFQFLKYGESIKINGVDVSFHPAGHMLGSAQVRLEYRGQIAVVTGDYKLGVDPTCASWQPIKCHLMVTESTRYFQEEGRNATVIDSRLRSESDEDAMDDAAASDAMAAPDESISGVNS